MLLVAELFQLRLCLPRLEFLSIPLELWFQQVKNHFTNGVTGLVMG